MAARRSGNSQGIIENCNRNVVCPCLVSKTHPSRRDRPSECNVCSIFHIDGGSYDGTRLDGLNVAVHHTPVPWRTELVGRRLHR